MSNNVDTRAMYDVCTHERGVPIISNIIAAGTNPAGILDGLHRFVHNVQTVQSCLICNLEYMVQNRKFNIEMHSSP